MVCLKPFYDNLYETLMEQLAEDPGIFRVPGDETGLFGFGEAWMGAVRDLPGGTAALSAGLVNGQLKDLEEVGTRPGRFARCRG